MCLSSQIWYEQWRGRDLARVEGIIDRPDDYVYEFLVTVKAAPHECVIRTGQPKT